MLPAPSSLALAAGAAEGLTAQPADARLGDMGTLLLARESPAGTGGGAGGTEGALCRLCGVTMAIGERESKQIKQNSSQDGGHFRALCEGLVGGCLWGGCVQMLFAFRSRSWIEMLSARP